MIAEIYGSAIAFMLGAVSMFGMVLWAFQQERKHIKKTIRAVCSKDEKVICYNASIVEDAKGQISWVDNDKDIFI